MLTAMTMMTTTMIDDGKSMTGYAVWYFMPNEVKMECQVCDFIHYTFNMSKVSFLQLKYNLYMKCSDILLYININKLNLYFYKFIYLL